MQTKTFLSFITIIVTLFVIPSTVMADVTITPKGICLVREDEDVIETTFTLTNSGEEEVGFFIRMRPRNWGDEEDRIPRRDRRGGPDDMEYEWRDNDEEDGLDFQWIDITEFEDVVEVENVEDDSYHGMFELGFEFEFYGEVYEEIGLHSNGWASFVNAEAIGFFYPDWCDNDLPHANGNTPPPPTLLAVNYQDLNPAIAGDIYYWTNEQDMAIITWEEISHFVDDQGDRDLWTFQVIVTSNGLIKYQYESVGVYDNKDMMIGLQNEDRDLGFTVVRQNFEYIEEERTVAFGQPSAWVSWLTYDPADGVIEADSEVEVTATVDTEDLEAGVYFATLIVNIDIDDEDALMFPVVVSVDSPVGSIEGSVIDPATDEAIPDAVIQFSPSEIIRISDDDGMFEVPNLPVGNYDISCTSSDYFDAIIENVEVEEGEVTDVTFELLHAECLLDREDIEVALEPGSEISVEFDLTNGGNAQLTWRVERHLLGDADNDPWELRERIEVGEIVEDSYLSGVVYVDGLYYISGGNNRQNDNFVYVINEDGEEVDRFEQFAQSRYGMRDLDWDGELIWGGDAGMVYGFTTAGDLEVEFEADVNPARAIAWDTELNTLWVASEGTDIFGYDREGNLQAIIEKEDNIALQGISYYPEDPEGFNLYIFSREGEDEDSDTRVYKLNTDNGEIRFVADLELDDRAGGLYISNQFDIYSWVFVGILENAGRTPDALGIWQIDVRVGWMEVEPTEGVVEAGESAELELTLNSVGLPVAEFEGELIFVHDGLGGETHLPVTMNITEGPVQTRRQLNLNFGWNLVSLNIEPDLEDVVELTAELVADDNLIMMKNGAGQFYVPSADFNNIPGWFVEEGYQMKLARDARLTVDGMSVVADEPIPLEEGWNLTSYFPRRSVDAVLALSALVETDHLIIAKDGDGHFYVPEFGFTNMGLMSEGYGYKLNVDADVELIYVQEPPEDTPAVHRSIHRQISSSKEGNRTGNNMSLLVLSDDNLNAEIAVFANGLQVGSGILEDGYAGIAIWGDDPTTEVIDGAESGDRIELKILGEGKYESVGYKTIKGMGKYSTDGFWVLQLESTETSSAIGSFELLTTHPNPFNSQTTISYSVQTAGRVQLQLYDINGRLVSSIFNGYKEVGVHTLLFSGDDLVSGVYFVNLTARGKSANQKIVLIK